MPHLDLTVLTKGTKSDVCENEFTSFKLKFHTCNFKQAFYPLHKLYIT